MPRLSNWFIRLSFLYLFIGFTLGALLLTNKGRAIDPRLWQLLQAHIELLLLGWITQLGAGVAFWILPRFKEEPKRGNVALAWSAFWLLNAGIWFVVFGAYILQAGAWLVLVGRLAEGLAVLLFLVYAWPRVRPSGA